MMYFSMSDQSLPRIVLPPVSDATPVTPPTPAAMPAAAPAPTATIPLQPVPPVRQDVPAPSTPTSSTPPQPLPADPVQPAPSVAQLQQTGTDLQQKLDTISKEENKILGTIKDWVAWIQGAETKKQTIERELKTIDQQLQGASHGQAQPHAAAAPAGPSRHELEQKLQAAELKLKTIQSQQKLEEKKAFDNYSTGGTNREGLIKDMDRINGLYDPPLAEAKTNVANWQDQLKKTQPVEPMPVASTVSVASTSSATTPTAPSQPNLVTAPTTKIIERLRALEQAQGGVAKQLLVDLPQQGQTITVQRSADGNGIIVLAGTETNYTLAQHFSDADLIRAGLGAEDIIPLPNGTLSAAQLKPPAAA